MTGPKSKDVKYSVAFPIATPAKRPARTHNMTSTFIYQSANATISAESRWRSTVYVNGSTIPVIYFVLKEASVRSVKACCRVSRLSYQTSLI